ncbi:MAG: hypothetical protein PHR24_02450 [Oscillospiraceae bacterium]|nr:hypothetical protein [Oscillospiraceae bacterium]
MKPTAITLEASLDQPAANGRYLYGTLNLPASYYEIFDFKQRMRAAGRSDHDFEFSVIDCPALPGLTDTRLDAPIIGELNAFALRLTGLDGVDRCVLNALFQSLKKEEDDLISLKDLINLTYGLQNVVIAANIRNDEELGQFVIENDMHDDVTSVPENARYLLDKKLIGKLQRQNDDGIYSGGLYVATNSLDMPKDYDGEHLPDDPERFLYVFRLLIAEAPMNNSEETRGSAEWIELPITHEDALRIAKRHNEAGMEDCVFYDFDSVIPQITAEVFGDMLNFSQLNSLADRYQRMNESGQLKFKAVLEGEKINTLTDAIEVIPCLDEYTLSYYCADKADFAREYLAYHLANGFDSKWLEQVNPAQMGEKILERLGAKETSYGVLSARRQSLYKLVPFDEPVAVQDNTAIKQLTLDALKKMTGREGLIIQGCGGDLQEWVDGINTALNEAGIFSDGNTFKDVFVFEHNGITNLLFDLNVADVNVSALAMWRLRAHSQFGGTWLSDYLTNQFGIDSDQISDETAESEEDDEDMEMRQL